MVTLMVTVMNHQGWGWGWGSAGGADNPDRDSDDNFMPACKLVCLPATMPVSAAGGVDWWTLMTKPLKCVMVLAQLLLVSLTRPAAISLKTGAVKPVDPRHQQLCNNQHGFRQASSPMCCTLT